MFEKVIKKEKGQKWYMPDKKGPQWYIDGSCAVCRIGLDYSTNLSK